MVPSTLEPMNKRESLYQNDTKNQLELPDKWIACIEAIDYAFQPIVNINNGQCYAYEALLRNFREAGFHSISDIFDQAFNENILHTLDLNLRRKAIEKFKKFEWSNRTKLFYNIDSRNWESKDYNLKKTLENYQVTAFPAESVCFEISEIHPINLKKLSAILDYIKAQGFKIAVDDCGSGFAGMKLIYHTEPNFVKIDRFFITDIANNPKKRLFVTNIVNMAHMMGGLVIAEGVETQNEFFICREIGCDFVQGYFIDFPQIDLSQLKQSYEHIHELSGRDRRKSHESDKNNIQSKMVYIEPLLNTVPVVEVFEKFKSFNDISVYPIVNREGEPLGIVHERLFKPYAYSRYGSEILRNRSINQSLDKFIIKCPIVDIHTPLENILEMFSENLVIDGIIVLENLKYAGFLDATSLLKALHEKNLAYARDLNPLSKLPGNNIINQYLSDALLHVMANYHLIYFDLDNFKPFNDKYGFRNGDRVLILFADILKKRLHKKEFFIGHIGGDDFFIGVHGCNHDDVIKEVEEIIDTFKQDVKSFYSNVDLDHGYIISKDRDDVECKFPLLTVSAVIVELPKNRQKIYTIGEIGEMIASHKRQAKRSPEKYICCQM